MSKSPKHRYAFANAIVPITSKSFRQGFLVVLPSRACPRHVME